MKNLRLSQFVQLKIWKLKMSHQIRLRKATDPPQLATCATDVCVCEMTLWLTDNQKKSPIFIPLTDLLTGWLISSALKCRLIFFSFLFFQITFSSINLHTQSTNKQGRPPLLSHRWLTTCSRWRILRRFKLFLVSILIGGFSLPALHSHALTPVFYRCANAYCKLRCSALREF